MNNMNQMNGNGFNPQQQPNNKFFLNFQPNDILQKEFKTKMRGYDQAEVDQFLDGIIKDYESYANELNRLKAENNRLQQQLNSIPQSNQTNNGQNNNNNAQAQNGRQRMNRTIPVQPKTAPMSNFNSNKAKPDASTYDILRRISNLEKHVFGHDFANGVPNQSSTDNKNGEPIKQFASAAVPNNNMNNNQGNPFESGHNEINPDSMQQNMNNNNNMNNPVNNNNLTPNHFDANRQNMNGFGQNLNNNGNMNQF